MYGIALTKIIGDQIKEITCRWLKESTCCFKKEKYW